MEHKTVGLILLAAFLFVSCVPSSTISPVEIPPTLTSPSATDTIGVTPSVPAPAKEISAGGTVEASEGKMNSYITIQPQESKDILINPGKGWILYYPNVDIPGEIWDLVSVCYTRLDWNLIEPTEGNFIWADIDASIKECANRGKKFAFGIMPANSSSHNEYVTPRWVFTTGAQSILYQGAKGQWIRAPVWNDPVYLEKMQNLINSLTQRYDGNPDIAFIDARNCGNWGEWHSLGCSELSSKDQAALIDQWKVFKQTVIVVPTNGDIAQYQARYGADTYGFGIRRDSSETDQNSARYAFDIGPAVSEWSTTYEMLKTCQGWSHVCWSEKLIPDYMSKSRFSYDNLGQWGADAIHFYSENTALAREWANKMGYWFRLTDVTYPANLGNGANETLSFKVRNDGIAPIYVNKNKTFVRLALLDDAGIVLAISGPLAGINPYAWKPGLVSYATSGFYFPKTPNAVHLAIGLFSTFSLTDPDIKWGNAGALSSNWLPLQDKRQP